MTACTKPGSMPCSAGGDDVGERPRAGLGGSRGKAGGGEQPVYEARSGETRRLHGECERYHINQGAYASPDVPPIDMGDTVPSVSPVSGSAHWNVAGTGLTSAMPESARRYALRCAGVFG